LRGHPELEKHCRQETREVFFNTEEAFTRFDMSEFKEEHTVSKLIGSPPGYVGYEQGGMLTNEVRESPSCCSMNSKRRTKGSWTSSSSRLMRGDLLIAGDRLCSSRKLSSFSLRTLDVARWIIGANTITELAALEGVLANIGLSFDEKQQSIRDHFLRAVEQFFMFEISRPELLNRIGSNIVPFNYIHNPETQREIVASHLRRIASEFEGKSRQSGFHLRSMMKY
jgi:ATP-dependent Clp protease ATP-binding subunit ClpA